MTYRNQKERRREGKHQNSIFSIDQILKQQEESEMLFGFARYLVQEGSLFLLRRKIFQDYFENVNVDVWTEATLFDLVVNTKAVNEAFLKGSGIELVSAHIGSLQINLSSIIVDKIKVVVKVIGKCEASSSSFAAAAAAPTMPPGNFDSVNSSMMWTNAGAQQDLTNSWAAVMEETNSDEDTRKIINRKLLKQVLEMGFTIQNLDLHVIHQTEHSGLTTKIQVSLPLLKSDVNTVKDLSKSDKHFQFHMYKSLLISDFEVFFQHLPETQKSQFDLEEPLVDRMCIFKVEFPKTASDAADIKAKTLYFSFDMESSPVSGLLMLKDVNVNVSIPWVRATLTPNVISIVQRLSVLLTGTDAVPVVDKTNSAPGLPPPTSSAAAAAASYQALPSAVCSNMQVNAAINNIQFELRDNDGGNFEVLVANTVCQYRDNCVSDGGFNGSLVTIQSISGMLSYPKDVSKQMIQVTPLSQLSMMDLKHAAPKTMVNADDEVFLAVCKTKMDANMHCWMGCLKLNVEMKDVQWFQSTMQQTALYLPLTPPDHPDDDNASFASSNFQTARDFTSMKSSAMGESMYMSATEFPVPIGSLVSSKLTQASTSTSTSAGFLPSTATETVPSNGLSVPVLLKCEAVEVNVRGIPDNAHVCTVLLLAVDIVLHPTTTTTTTTTTASTARTSHSHFEGIVPTLSAEVVVGEASVSLGTDGYPLYLELRMEGIVPHVSSTTLSSKPTAITNPAAIRVGFQQWAKSQHNKVDNNEYIYDADGLLECNVVVSCANLSWNHAKYLKVLSTATGAEEMSSHQTRVSLVSDSNPVQPIRPDQDSAAASGLALHVNLVVDKLEVDLLPKIDSFEAEAGCSLDHAVVDLQMCQRDGDNRLRAMFAVQNVLITSCEKTLISSSFIAERSVDHPPQWYPKPSKNWAEMAQTWSQSVPWSAVNIVYTQNDNALTEQCFKKVHAEVRGLCVNVASVGHLVNEPWVKALTTEHTEITNATNHPEQANAAFSPTSISSAASVTTMAAGGPTCLSPSSSTIASSSKTKDSIQWQLVCSGLRLNCAVFNPEGPVLALYISDLTVNEKEGGIGAVIRELQFFLRGDKYIKTSRPSHQTVHNTAEAVLFVLTEEGFHRIGSLRETHVSYKAVPKLDIAVNFRSVELKVSNEDICSIQSSIAVVTESFSSAAGGENEDGNVTNDSSDDADDDMDKQLDLGEGKPFRYSGIGNTAEPMILESDHTITHPSEPNVKPMTAAQLTQQELETNVEFQENVASGGWTGVGTESSDDDDELDFTQQYAAAALHSRPGHGAFAPSIIQRVIKRAAISRMDDFHFVKGSQTLPSAKNAEAKRDELYRSCRFNVSCDEACVSLLFAKGETLDVIVRQIGCRVEIFTGEHPLVQRLRLSLGDIIMTSDNLQQSPFLRLLVDPKNPRVVNRAFFNVKFEQVRPPLQDGGYGDCDEARLYVEVAPLDISLGHRLYNRLRNFLEDFLAQTSQGSLPPSPSSASTKQKAAAAAAAVAAPTTVTKPLVFQVFSLSDIVIRVDYKHSDAPGWKELTNLVDSTIKFKGGVWTCVHGFEGVTELLKKRHGAKVMFQLFQGLPAVRVVARLSKSVYRAANAGWHSESLVGGVAVGTFSLFKAVLSEIENVSATTAGVVHGFARRKQKNKAAITTSTASTTTQQ